MFTIPQPITVVAVKDFISDEVHITGKSIGEPRAILSFIAVDADGKRVPNAPVAVVTLTGAAYNSFYSNWTSEAQLYKSLLDMLADKTPGMDVSGVDLVKVAGILKSTEAGEIIAEVVEVV